LDVDLLKEALNPAVMRVRLGGTRKSGGEFCKIDCFDFESSDDQARKVFVASEITAKMKLEDIGEHGSMIHGVISWYVSRCGNSLNGSHDRRLHHIFQ
jgi:hypothetical protein